MISVLAKTPATGEGRALAVLHEVSVMGKTVYDFCASPPADADECNVAEDALTATGTHLVDGWRAYQKWLRQLRDEIDVPAASKQNSASR